MSGVFISGVPNVSWLKQAWERLMAALGIRSVRLTPTPAGNLDSRYDDGDDSSGQVAPSAPTLGTPVVTGTTSIDVPLSVASTGPSTPITYVLERSLAGAGAWTVADSGDIFANDGIASVTGLTANTQYDFRCKAVGANLLPSTYSETVSATTAATAGDTTAPGAPGTPTFSGTTSSGTLASWTAATDNVAVTGYDILLGQGDGAGNPVGSGTIIGTSPTNSFQLTGLSANQQYYIRVRAKDAAGNVGSYTSRAFFTTSAAASVAFTLFDDFTAAAIDTTKWNLSVNRSDGNTATGVEIVTEPITGVKALRSRITWVNESDHRAELNDKIDKSSPNAAAFGADLWYGFWVLIPTDWVSASGADIFWQTHMRENLEPTSESSSPTLALQIQDTRFRIYRAYNPAQPSTASTKVTTAQYVGNYTKGVWNQIVINAVPYYDNRGYTKIWINGNVVYDVVGGNCAKDTYCWYNKFGLYSVGFKSSNRGAGVSPRIIYHTKYRYIRSGGSYSAIVNSW